MGSDKGKVTYLDRESPQAIAAEIAMLDPKNLIVCYMNKETGETVIAGRWDSKTIALGLVAEAMVLIGAKK